MSRHLPALLLVAVGVIGLSNAPGLVPVDADAPRLAFAGVAGASPAATADINWMSWDQAVAANKSAAKPLIIDVYTDWCGWCKRMDATTFKDPRVAEYVNANFYAVKLDAEQKGDIVYDGTTFSFQQQGRRGVHTLAASLLDGRLSYPSIVYFNGKMERTMISPGFKDADALLAELKQAAGK